MFTRLNVTAGNLYYFNPLVDIYCGIAIRKQATSYKQASCGKLTVRTHFLSFPSL